MSVSPSESLEFSALMVGTYRADPGNVNMYGCFLLSAGAVLISCSALSRATEGIRKRDRSGEKYGRKEV